MNKSNLVVLVDTIRAEFTRRQSRAPRWVVAAPGRVNLIGEHIDYNDGFVLPMAIDRYTVIAAAEGKDTEKPIASIESLDMNASATIAMSLPLTKSSEGWSTYVEGVIAGFLERGLAIPSFDAIVQTTVPLGGGLSSSAALEVAMATLLEAITDKSLDPVEKALLCQQAEHRFAGMPCGIMDQFSSVFGRADELMLIDCQSYQVHPVPFAPRDVSVLIANSNVRHELTGSEYADRRAQCEAALSKLGKGSWRDVSMEDVEKQRAALTPIEYRRARHIVTEIERTLAAAEAIAAGDLEEIGKQMYASHESLRDDYEVSCAEIDRLVDIASELGTQNGVIGARITGGGFGGCTVNLVRTDSADRIAESIRERYERETGIKPDIFITRPARGAHVVEG